MFIQYLFTDETLNEVHFIDKIILDTNLNNIRAQHVYEKLGFTKLRINKDIWKDQLGVNQSSVDYEMLRKTYMISNKI
jgi:ribosomal protein S18 acetylase RimI-like enzyme